MLTLNGLTVSICVNLNMFFYSSDEKNDNADWSGF